MSPFFHSQIDYTKESIEQSIHYLETFSENKGCSAICNNLIDEKPFFDLQIIIPAYNVEEYIEQCIDSILHQITTFKYLICIINDGSTDNTRELLKKYEKELESNYQYFDDDMCKDHGRREGCPRIDHKRR